MLFHNPAIPDSIRDNCITKQASPTIRQQGLFWFVSDTSKIRCPCSQHDRGDGPSGHKN